MSPRRRRASPLHHRLEVGARTSAPDALGTRWALALRQAFGELSAAPQAGGPRRRQIPAASGITGSDAGASNIQPPASDQRRGVAGRRSQWPGISHRRQRGSSGVGRERSRREASVKSIIHERNDRPPRRRPPRTGAASPGGVPWADPPAAAFERWLAWSAPTTWCPRAFGASIDRRQLDRYRAMTGAGSRIVMDSPPQWEDCPFSCRWPA